MHFQRKGLNKNICLTIVYATCSALEKLELWEDLESISDQMEYTWLVFGDFNTIRDEDEKLEGLFVTQQETIDFVSCISS